MSVELSYRIVNLSHIGNSVKMVLQEVRLIPKEEIERALQEAELTVETEENVGEQLQKVASMQKKTYGSYGTNVLGHETTVPRDGGCIKKRSTLS